MALPSMDFNVTDNDSFTDNDSVVDCEINETDQWNSYSILSALFLLEFILAFFSFVVNFLFLLIIFRVKVMPINVRCLLAHLSFNLMWFAAAIIYKSMSFLLFDPCSFKMNAFQCKLREMSFTLPGTAILYSILGICVERLFSTFYKRNREHAAMPPIMASLFVFLTWLATLASHIYLLLSTPRDRFVAVCESAFSLNAQTAKAQIAFNSVFEIAAISVMVAVTMYENYVSKNMAINRVLYKLSSRFLITQNVEVNALMLPSMILHAVCFLPGFAFSFLVVFNIPMNTSTKWMFIHFGYLWRVFYSLAHPILAFSRNFHIKKQMKKNAFCAKLILLWKRSSAKVVATYNSSAVANEEGKVHFQYLEQLWTTSYRQRKFIVGMSDMTDK